MPRDKGVFRYTKTNPDGTRYEYGNYQIRWTQNGVKHCESAETESYKDAVDRLNEKRADVSSGLLLPSDRKQSVNTILLSMCTKNKANNQRSHKSTKGRCVNHLIPFLGHLRATELATDTIWQYISHRQGQEASAATINRELAAIKRAYNMAIQGRTLSQRPYVPKLEERNIRAGFFERDQLESVLKQLPEPIRPVVRMAYITGWRTRSEILPLTWGHIDTGGGMIRLDPGTAKNKEGRLFPFKALPELERVITGQWGRHQELSAAGKLSPWVFCWEDGRPIKDFRKSWEEACKKSGVPGRLVHDMRRTAVRNMVRAGIPEKTAQMLSGHKTRSVFDRYNIITESDLVRAAGMLSGKVKTELYSKKVAKGK
jgi:integrase